MKIGYFNFSELADKSGAVSPFGDQNVKTEVYVLLNAIRGDYGKPIRVSSGYRSPEHNEDVNGVDGSFHTKGLAADLHDLHDDPRGIRELWEIAERLNPAGGVGLYDWGVHVDCRGYRARWDGRRYGD